MTDSRIPVVIDTDLGADPDDAFALVLALCSPEIDVLGVTVVDGDVDLRARMAARLLGLAGRPDVPIFKGASRPIGPGRGPTILGTEGKGLLDLPYDGADARISDIPAAEWLVAESARRRFHLVAIGPLSNVACAIQGDRHFAGRLRGLTIMGGVLDDTALPEAWQDDVRRRGCIAAWPDHNTASDPTAALLCSQSGTALTWITTEVTVRTPLRADSLHRLPLSPLASALRRMVDSWNAEWFRVPVLTSRDASSLPDDTVGFLHDPLTVAALFPAEWLSLQRMALCYAIEDGVFRLRRATDGAQVNANVSVAVDGDRFEQFCLSRIARHIANTESQVR